MAKSWGLAPVGTSGEPLKTVGISWPDDATHKADQPPFQAAELGRLEAPLLQPKRIPPLRAAALRLKEIGYDPIALRNGKDTPNVGWPMTPNEPARIARWTGRTLAIRLKGSDLFVIDLDVHVAGVRDAIVAGLTARWPGFMVGCLRRHSQRVTLALIGRASTVKRSFATRWFTGGGTGPKGDRVEFLTGNNVKYVGVWGVHSEGREYGYHGRSILEVPAGTLPWFPDADIYKACDLCEEIMRARGLVQRSPEGGKQGYGAKQVYDLEPEMIFTLGDGDQMTLAELEDYAHVWQPLRPEDGSRLVGYATLWDPDSTTPDRVHVLLGSTGLVLHDFKTNTTRRWKHRAPPAELAELTATLRALVKGAWS